MAIMLTTHAVGLLRLCCATPLSAPRLTARLSMAPRLSLAAMDCWRPSPDDVDAISWGRRAKTRGVGSRGVPHRLNDDERTMYDIARTKGFVELRGSGWRKERSDSPLRNTYRSWCDSIAVPAIFLHKGGDGVDEVIIDLTPLRSPESFGTAAAACLTLADDGRIEPLAPRDPSWMYLTSRTDGRTEEAESEAEVEVTGPSVPPPPSTTLPADLAGTDLTPLPPEIRDAADAYRREPIYRLPMYAISWVRPRAAAKTLAKDLAAQFGTVGKTQGRSKSKGAPRRKAGKSRKHGGYGIEG